MSAKGKIATVSFICLAVLCLGGIFWPKSKAPVEKQELLKYIEQKEFQYNRRYIKAIQSLFLDGDREITSRLATKYIDTTQKALWPDEKLGKGAPVGYRPYLEPQDDDFRFRYGIGISVHQLFEEIEIFEDRYAGAMVIYDTVLKELQRMRKAGVVDAHRVHSIEDLLRSKCLAIGKMEHRELTCELIYVYACYEYWPSIRYDTFRILGATDGRLRNEILSMVDDEGIESALEYIDPAMLSKFKESGNLHKKAPPPAGVELTEVN